MDEVDRYMRDGFKTAMIQTLEKLIKYEFPKIKNLTIEFNGEKINIQFDKGEYSEDEVSNKINQYRKGNYEC